MKITRRVQLEEERILVKNAYSRLQAENLVKRIFRSSIIPHIYTLFLSLLVSTLFFSLFLLFFLKINASRDQNLEARVSLNSADMFFHCEFAYFQLTKPISLITAVNFGAR